MQVNGILARPGVKGGAWRGTWKILERQGRYEGTARRPAGLLPGVGVGLLTNEFSGRFVVRLPPNLP